MPRTSTAGGFLVPGSTVTHFDENELLRQTYETNVIAAARRFEQEAKRKGYHVTNAEARASVIARAESGDLSELPQYKSMRDRMKGDEQ